MLIPNGTMKPANLKGLRILVVDDNVTTVRLVADVLRASGVGQVHTACSGLEALELLRSIQPHIIFVDWEMPAMDGLAFTRRVRHAAVDPDPAVPDPMVPIIVLTGRKRVKDVQMARLAGMNEFVGKPFTPAALLGRIHAVIAQPREFVSSSRYVGPDRRRKVVVDYGGPLRRSRDPRDVVDGMELDDARKTMVVELQALRQLTLDRGGADREAMQMCYRAVRNNVGRARAVRDLAVEQASNSLLRYFEAMGGPSQADPAVVEVHMDAMRNLLNASEPELAKAAQVNGHLEEAVSKKISDKLELVI
jgi:CheY-like chemotaxis protein